MKRFSILAVLILIPLLAGCKPAPTSNDVQREMSNKLLDEATAQTGMPSIKNFRERKLLKDILELRDQEGLLTYTYLWSEMKGELTFFCESFGYGIPYATQYTSPTTMQRWTIRSSSGEGTSYGVENMPQADPNGLFSPDAAEGTWVMCKAPGGKDVRPVLVEPRAVVSPFRLEG